MTSFSLVVHEASTACKVDSATWRRVHGTTAAAADDPRGLAVGLGTRCCLAAPQALRWRYGRSETYLGEHAHRLTLR